jgi:hypothetical protein
MKKWSFGFRVKEWFLTPRNWDQYYEAGDSREVVTMFYADSPDVNLAKAKLHKDAEEDDMIIEILGLEFCKEIEVETYQKPIGHLQKL